MPKFISDRDVRFFKGIARELVDDVIQNTVVLFKIDLSETRVNLYGESVNKQWHPGVELYALINKETLTVDSGAPMMDINQSLTIKLDRFMCEEKNVYPEIGDVILFDTSYYEIENTSEIQYVGGMPFNNFSIVCNVVMVSKTGLNIESRVG
jgi:hypothetical protein